MEGRAEDTVPILWASSYPVIPGFDVLFLAVQFFPPERGSSPRQAWCRGKHLKSQERTGRVRFL